MFSIQQLMPVAVAKRLLRRVGVSLVLLLIGAVKANAALEFEKAVVEDVILPSVQQYPFEFEFKNTGESSVGIRELKTSCGCTTAQLEKKTYLPGESGTIAGSFSVGSRRGLQQKTIRVITEDLGQPEIKLGLKLEIPRLVTMKPGLLFWRQEDAVEAKTVRLKLNPTISSHIVSAESESDQFQVALAPADEEGVYNLSIVPTALGSGARSRIKITIASDEAGQVPVVAYAHAIIK